MKKSRIVVTGGAGFIGSNIVHRLVEEGHDVVVVDDFSTGRMANLEDIKHRINIVNGSITDLELLKRAFKGADYVLHQAALPSVPRSIEDPITTHNVNALGTLNVFIAARDTGVKKVVYASSSSVYGDSEESPKHEGLPYNPLSPYASQKALSEHYGKIFYKLYDLNTIGLRYFNVFGPRQSPDSQYSAAIPKFIKLILAGKKPTIYGDGSTSRDFTYVENVVEANILALESDAFGAVMNIAFGETTTLNDVIMMINEELGTDIVPLYVEGKKGDIKHSHASIALAKRMLKYIPKIAFREGLRRTIEHIRKELEK